MSNYDTIPVDNPNSRDTEGQFSFFTTLAFSINFAMGAGFLSLPWAFYKTGVVLGLLTLAAIAVPMMVTIPFYLEAMARTDAVHTHRKELQETTGLIRHYSDAVNDVKSGGLIVDKEKYEISEICHLFLGRRGKRLFIICISIYTYGCLWAFTSVFGQALADIFPIFIGDADYSYLIYVCLFAAIVLPATCLEVTEQVYMQVFLAFCRVLVIVLMVSSALGAYLHHGGSLPDATPPPLFRMSGIPTLLPIAAYAFMFTQCMPLLAQPASDKSKLSYVFIFTILFCFLGYGSIGLIVSLLFGDTVEQSCNLNWISYATPDMSPYMYFLAMAVANYVVAFPALDVLAAFPLNAITLADNLFWSFYGNASKAMPKGYLLLFRLLASAPPIIGGYFVSDLGRITDFTGIFGCILALLFPPLLGLYSERYFNERGWNAHTVYSSELTSKMMKRAVLGYGVFVIIFVLVSNFMV